MRRIYSRNRVALPQKERLSANPKMCHGHGFRDSLRPQTGVTLLLWKVVYALSPKFHLTLLQFQVQVLGYMMGHCDSFLLKSEGQSWSTWDIFLFFSEVTLQNLSSFYELGGWKEERMKKIPFCLSGWVSQFFRSYPSSLQLLNFILVFHRITKCIPHFGWTLPSCILGNH